MWYDKGQDIYEKGTAYMSGFENIAPNVYYLAPPVPEFGGGVTLITGTTVILIDCGAFDYSVSKFIVPALKAIKLDIKDIDYLLFTHCHPENMGGVHKLKQLSPDTKILSYGYQTDKLKNPSFYFMKNWSNFLDFSPPFRELKGVLPDGTVDPESLFFQDQLRPIFAQGHDSDCVCWYHTKSETLICGDAIQGGGTDDTGIAYITTLQYYKNTVSDIIELAPQNLICSKKFKGLEAVTKGKDACQKALDGCFSALDEYLVFVDRYSRLTRKKKENLDPQELATAYFEGKAAPSCLGYAMHTFSEFIKNKR